MNKKIKQILAVSFAINLLLIGAVVGHLIKSQVRDDRHMPPIPKEITKLSHDKQELFQDAMRSMRQNHDKFEDEIRKYSSDVAHSLQQEPFDAEAFQISIDKLHTLRGQQVQHMADAAKKLAAQFSKEERGVLAQLLHRPPPHHRGGHPPPPHHRGGRPPPPHSAY